MAEFPTLDTPRLLLRELVIADAPALFAIHGDAIGMRWFGGDPMIDVRQAERLIEAFASWRAMPNPGVRWGLVHKRDGELIGSCGLFKWNRSWKTCTVGYELAQSARGAGLMHEALTAALDWGFDQMTLNRIEAQIHPDNAPSLKLAQTLGFVREGTAREAGFWQGAHHDLLHFSLLRRDWLHA
ncbi:GNAT family protein [Paraburkholderia sp.]|uniref:GNAT family N-acetyltransferase n=1 Tax=Paraburkholderia sp. TaxID=1926495 RepID=UPI0023A008C8|nr:GNAT family protein [Paraburkholderia sp.]MDE1179581.1 GNAT family protein [Paraburkholderia sp.]